MSPRTRSDARRRSGAHQTELTRCWRALLLASAALVGACSSRSGNSPESKPCDAKCQDQIAVRGLRETMKLGYNLTLQGNPVGAQDETTRCLSGSGRVFGEATANPDQGATNVQLTYQLTACEYQRTSATQNENYDLTFDGELRQSGVLAVQPTATTAIVITAESVSASGTVYDPAIEYEASGCSVSLVQDGNDLSGSWCGRHVGVSL